jgi:predicted esterase
MDFIHKFTPGKVPVTVLLLHGSGGDEDDLLPIAKALVPGAAFLSPRGNVVQNGIRRFFSFPGPDGFDREELIERGDDLTEWVNRMKTDYAIDASRFYALGYSNGANIAAAMMLFHPGTIAGACLFRSRALAVPAVLPALHDMPVVISAGQSDHLIPAADSERLGRLLSEAGAKVDFVLQNAGHDLTPADFSLAKQWFARLL